MSELTERNRAIWSAGNWDEVADYVGDVGPRLLARGAAGERWPELVDALRGVAEANTVDGKVRADYLRTEIGR